MDAITRCDLALHAVIPEATTLSIAVLSFSVLDSRMRGV